MKVAFWNLRGAPASNACVHGLVTAERPHLIALAEHTDFDKNRPPAGYEYRRLSTRLAILTRGNAKPHVLPPIGRLRKFAQVVQISGWSIPVCHLKSLVNDGAAERNRLMRMLKSHLIASIPKWEKIAVIGDLNIDPWEPGIVDKESLHGLQTRVEAGKGLDYDGDHFRALLNETYQLARPFAFVGGETWRTYRDKESKLHSSLRWHLFDQALVSADVKARVKVRTELPTLPWHEGLGTKAGASVYPDHLPIVVELGKA